MDSFKLVKEAVKAPKPSEEEKELLNVAMVVVHAEHPEYNLGTMVTAASELVTLFQEQWEQARKAGTTFHTFICQLRHEQLEKVPALKVEFERWKAKR